MDLRTIGMDTRVRVDVSLVTTAALYSAGHFVPKEPIGARVAASAIDAAYVQ